MGRYKKDVKYWNKGGYWYYKTRDMSGYMSTGEKNKTKAEAVVAKLRQKNIAGNPNPLFKDYAEPFFDWDCSRIMRNRSLIGIGVPMQQGLRLKVSILVNGIVRMNASGLLSMCWVQSLAKCI